MIKAMIYGYLMYKEIGTLLFKKSYLASYVENHRDPFAVAVVSNHGHVPGEISLGCSLFLRRGWIPSAAKLPAADAIQKIFFKVRVHMCKLAKDAMVNH